MATIYGTDSDDALVGTAQADQIDGFDGNDTLTGGAGNDTIYGGSGDDVAVFDGNRADFIITTGNDYYRDRVLVISETEGYDEVFEVETLRFDDEEFSVSQYLDDYGDTPETAGTFELVDDYYDGREYLSANGRIGFDGDRDMILATLTAETRYHFDLGGYGDLEFHTVSIVDPNGDEIAAFFKSEDQLSEYTTTFSLETTTAGIYQVIVSSTEASDDDYSIQIEEVRLIGDDGDEILRGTDDDDTLVPGAGYDTINGREGSDTVVLSGNRADYQIDVEYYYDEEVIVYLQKEDGNKTLENIEIIRFDDQDLILAEYDDVGDTAETAGQFDEWTYDRNTELSADGRIENVGDVDVFGAELEAGRTYMVSLSSYGYDDFEVSGVFDAEGTSLGLQQFPLDPDYYYPYFANHMYFRPDETGTYYFEVAGKDEDVGEYNLELTSRAGSDYYDDLTNSPYDDVIEAGDSDDRIEVILAGNDVVDGGSGEDVLSVYSPDDDYNISVTEDGAVEVSSANGTVTATGVEFFGFGESGYYSDSRLALEDILAMDEVSSSESPLNVQFVEPYVATATEGHTNDVYQGTWYDDVIVDAGGANFINAGDGYDKVGLLSGTNVVDGGYGEDLIIGGIGNDDLSGGEESDVIRSDISDNLFGADTLTGGEGDDLLEGGGGADVFVFNRYDGSDTIGKLDIDYDQPSDTTVIGADFESGLDKIQLDGFGYASADAAFAKVTDIGGVATFDDQGTQITFAGLTVADLSPEDFIIL